MWTQKGWPYISQDILQPLRWGGTFQFLARKHIIYLYSCILIVAQDHRLSAANRKTQYLRISLRHQIFQEMIFRTQHLCKESQHLSARRMPILL